MWMHSFIMTRLSFFLFFSLLCFLLTCTALHFSHLQTSTITTTTTTTIFSNRRTLHQPFFPLTSPSSSSSSSSSAIPPSLPPSPSAFPKYPSSSSSTSSSSSIFGPFFPLYPSQSPPPPPPPSSSSSSPSFPTFPANISSLASPSRHSPSKLAPALVLPILALLALSLVLVLVLLLLHRRRHRRPGGDSRSDDVRFLAADPSAASDAGKPTAAGPPAPAGGGGSSNSSEFLYLGTLVSPRCGRPTEGFVPASAAAPPVADCSSPELRPLPPLPRQFVNVDRNPLPSSSSSSPEAEKSSSAAAPGPKDDGEDRTTCSRSRSSSRSPPSCDALSSPSPSQLSPLPPLRPPTPSPPKRIPPSHSPPFSPPHEEKKAAAPQASGRNWSPRKIGDFASRNPPPPPPPPPQRGVHVASQSLDLPALQPPAFILPKGIAEPLNSSDASDKWKEEFSRPKLKPLHWDKVRASSDHAMVWDQLRSSSFELNEKEIETLFVCNKAHATKKEMRATKLNSSQDQGNRVLDPKKSQNIAILLRALNVTKEEVCEALLVGNFDKLSNELLDTLSKMVPSKEEECKLKECRDNLIGDPAESFLKAVLEVPFAFMKVDALLYIVNFDGEVNHLSNLFGTLEAACDELRNNWIFHKLLGAVLKTGNRMNIGTNRGDAQAFKLDTLLKLVDIKATDGKTSLLHFVIQEIVRTESSRLSSSNSSADTQTNAQADAEYRKLGFRVMLGLNDELFNVKKAAAMDADMVNSYVSKLSRGVGKIQEVLRLEDALPDGHGQRFHDAMVGFLKKAENKILDIQERECAALCLVKETTEYFHGDSAKEEAHPFRIFVVVRDFIAILDHVCKEVETTYYCNTRGTEDRPALTGNQMASFCIPQA